METNGSARTGGVIRPSTMRDANCDLVLQTLQASGPATRTGLASAISLTTQALGPIIADLIEEDLVRVTDVTSGGRGRPSAVYEVDPSAGYWLGVSVQWRSALLALVDASGALVARDRIEHRGTAMTKVIGEAAYAARRMVGNVPGAAKRLRAVGLSIQGRVDPSSGRVIHADAWPEIDTAPAAEFERRTGWYVTIDSAARATARAEVDRHPSGLVAVLYFSHDPSLVLVQDRRIVEGASGLSGSLAHLPLPGLDTVCACGRHGCMTTVASGSALVERYARETGHVVERAPEVVDAARDGDPRAKAALADFGEIVARMTALLLTFVDPLVLVVSGLVGGVDSRGANRFVEMFRDQLDGSPNAADLRVEISPFGRDAHEWGAISLARQARGLRIRPMVAELGEVSA